MKPVILILCTGNSCRSHMGEGILRSLAGDIFEARSAGSRPAGFVHPDAIKVMHVIGIDISRHESKSLEMFLHEPVHTVITVCGKVRIFLSLRIIGIARRDASGMPQVASRR